MREFSDQARAWHYGHRGDPQENCPICQEIARQHRKAFGIPEPLPELKWSWSPYE